MEVILVRHTSVDVPKGTCYGWTDVPVRDTFEQEAQATKHALEQFLPLFRHIYFPLNGIILMPKPTTD